MGNAPGSTNNPAHEKNLVRFNPETARAAALRSAEVRREKKRKREDLELANSLDIESWMDTYKREQMGEACAAAVQKIAHMVLDGSLTDQRALVSALPVLFEIARTEAGEFTSITAHASLSVPDSVARLQTIRAQALGQGTIDTTSSPPS